MSLMYAEPYYVEDAYTQTQTLVEGVDAEIAAQLVGVTAAIQAQTHPATTAQIAAQLVGVTAEIQAQTHSSTTAQIAHTLDSIQVSVGAARGSAGTMLAQLGDVGVSISSDFFTSAIGALGAVATPVRAQTQAVVGANSTVSQALEPASMQASATSFSQVSAKLEGRLADVAAAFLSTHHGERDPSFGEAFNPAVVKYGAHLFLQ